MTQNKICPDCNAEYHPHIENCADCGTGLKLPEEIERLKQERAACMGEAPQNSVVVKEGELKWLDELYHMLIDSGIPSTVNFDHCKQGCCGDKYRLLVSSGDAERASKRIEEYYTEIDPEFRAASENISQGKCPACSHPVGSDAVECPDCGLILLIVE
jgi:hypothetical protein